MSIRRDKPLGAESIHIWRRRRDLNPSHTGARRMVSPLPHPGSLEELLIEVKKKKVSQKVRLNVASSCNKQQRRVQII